VRKREVVAIPTFLISLCIGFWLFLSLSLSPLAPSHSTPIPATLRQRIPLAQ